MQTTSMSGSVVVERDYGAMRLVVGPRAVEAPSSTIDLKVLELEPGTSTSRHYHRRSETIFCVLEGDVEIESGARLAAPVGTVVVVPAGDRHQVHNVGTQRCRVLEIMSPPFSKDDYLFDEEPAWSSSMVR